MERQSVTAAAVTSRQIFRDLFSREILRPGERISVGAITIVFTDLKNSTRMYRDIGDAPAFGRVLNHFDVLNSVIADGGGAIVKTMGDAVMATFTEPGAALRAMRSAQAELAAARRHQEGLQLKCSIHQGPCLAINQNERLDYFGTTVNVCARLCSQSTGSDIVVSRAGASRPGGRRPPRKRGRPCHGERIRPAAGGWATHPYDFWRVQGALLACLPRSISGSTQATVHEHPRVPGKGPLRKFAASPSPGNAAATTLEGFTSALAQLPEGPTMVKSQIHAGGRGKGVFTDGYKGGVKFCRTKAEAREIAAQMLGKTLVTAQTGPAGRKVQTVYFTVASDIKKEYYLAILLDRAASRPVIVASTEGGVGDRRVAHDYAGEDLRVVVDPAYGIADFQVRELLARLGLAGAGGEERLACTCGPSHACTGRRTPPWSRSIRLSRRRMSRSWPSTRRCLSTTTRSTAIPKSSPFAT